MFSLVLFLMVSFGEAGAGTHIATVDSNPGTPTDPILDSNAIILSNVLETMKASCSHSFGNKKSCCRPLDKNARLERWKILFEAVAAGHGVVVTTNTDRPTSAAVNIGKDGDLDDQSDLSQNQSKF
tara:strand:- start:11 stop:388 length:378 start_codon:yes stop_codon:yes gene_type:complete